MRPLRHFLNYSLRPAPNLPFSPLPLPTSPSTIFRFDWTWPPSSSTVFLFSLRLLFVIVFLPSSLLLSLLSLFSVVVFPCWFFFFFYKVFSVIGLLREEASPIKEFEFGLPVPWSQHWNSSLKHPNRFLLFLLHLEDCESSGPFQIAGRNKQ